MTVEEAMVIILYLQNSDDMGWNRKVHAQAWSVIREKAPELLRRYGDGQVTQGSKE